MTRPVFAPLAAVALAAAFFATACGGGGGSSPSPSSPSSTASTTSTPATTTPTGSYAWTQDVKPILTSDCTRCHSGSRPSAGVDLSTYAGTMRVVAAGNANSTLVVVTRSGGAMYSYLSGDRAGKAEIIRSWVVSGAPENR